MAKAKKGFAQARNAETQYARQLRKVAKKVGEIIKLYGSDPDQLPKLNLALKQYAAKVKPWARKAAQTMLLDVDRRNEGLWAEATKEMSKSIGREIRTAPTGKSLTAFLEEQVHLITSLPLEAANRVHELTLRGLERGGLRADEIADQIMKTGEVTRNRANTIARTEVARTASAMTMVRAKHIGSKGYVWRTALDSDVRDSHRKMEGKFVRWDKPPTLSDGTTTHAGMIYNCRCYPEPVIPEEIR